MRTADFDRIAAKMRQCSIFAMAARKRLSSTDRQDRLRKFGRINSRPRQTEAREADPAGLEGRMASSRGRSP
jgi:hypothetical protein